jgi:hypothetical protein
MSPFNPRLSHSNLTKYQADSQRKRSAPRAFVRRRTLARGAVAILAASSAAVALPMAAAGAKTVHPATADASYAVLSSLRGASAAQSGGTLGETTVGATCSPLRSDYKRANEYTLGTAGTVTSMSVWLQPGGATGTQNVEGLIYADSNGPGALVASTTAVSFSNTEGAGWYTLTFATPPKLAAGKYWLGLFTGGTPNVAAYCYDAGSSTVRATDTNTYTSGPSNPFGAASYDSELMPLYASYTVASTPPSAPAGLVATAGSGQAALSWSPSTEPGGTITGYYVYRNGAQVANVSTPAYTDAGLTNGSTYSYYVEAYDSNGNVSAASATVTATPTAPITTGSCATAGTFWCGDFSTGDGSQYTQLLGQPTSDVTYPTSPTLSGLSHSARFQLRPGDLWTDGTSRMQLRQAPYTEGQDLYFHFGVYIDPSTTIGANFSNPWRTLVAWPTSEDGTCSPLKLMLMNTDGVSAQPNGTPSFVMAGDLGDCGANDVDQWVLPNPVKGAWYQFIVHIKFSATPGSGLEEFWVMPPGSNAYTKQTFNRGSLNGTQTFTGNTIGHPGDDDNLRLGIYRSTSFTTTDVIYYAGVRAATSFAAAQ